MAVDQNTELWRDLAELARNEKDPVRLLELTAEINRLLEVKLEKHFPTPEGETPSKKSA